MNTTISKQEQKSKETKERIYEALKFILETKGFQQLSLKNICKEAGVSNGSFYHHFDSKDDLLSYYIEDQPKIDPDLLEVPKDLNAVKETIIHVYLNYVKYCEELGVDFMANYYDTSNQALNPETRTQRPYPIITVQNYVEKAIKANVVQLNVKIEEFTTDIRMIVIGNVFEWCIRSNVVDFAGNMKRSLGKYLDSTLVAGEAKKTKP
jgi:AcrR family transcriptional regulator